jgi:hypothetical protein
VTNSNLVYLPKEFLLEHTAAKPVIFFPVLPRTIITNQRLISILQPSETSLTRANLNALHTTRPASTNCHSPFLLPAAPSAAGRCAAVG